MNVIINRMTNYSCDRCGYTTSKLSNYKQHINRNKVCNSNNNVDILQLYNKYNIPFDAKLISPLWKEYLTTNEISIVNRKQPFQCKYCNKYYTRNDNLKRHVEECKKKYLLLEELESQKKKIEYFSSNIDSLVNSKVKEQLKDICVKQITINANNNNSILVNNFGNEDISYITNDQLKKYALNIPNGIHQLAQRSHFNPQHPENMNIRIQDKDDELVQIWNNEKWIYKKRQKVLEYLIYHKLDILNEKIVEMNTNKELSEFKKQLLDNIREKYAEDDLYFQEIVKNMEIVLLNNSNLP